MTVAPKLAIGLLCSNQGIQKWQSNALTRAIDAGSATLGEVTLRPCPRSSAPSDQVLLWEKLAYRKRVERMNLVSAPRPAGPQTPALLIDLGEQPSPAAPDAPLGVLSVRFCGEADPRAMFRALAENQAISIEVVCRLGGEEQIVASAVYPIVDSRTLATTIESALARAELMLERAIATLAAEGAAAPHETSPAPEPPPPVGPWSAKPAEFVVRGVAQRFRRLISREEYFLAAAPRRSGVEADLGALPYRDDVRITFAPPGYFYADPFPIDHSGQEHLFFETKDYSTGRGRIDWALVNPDGSLGAVETVLDRPYHLSYPFVFEHEGEMYMIPETAQTGRIELYRAEDFPHGWRLVAPLIENISATDATLLWREDRVWLFATVGQNGASTWDELHAFHAPSLFGPWTPHARSPLKMDARSARPAGRFFTDNGRLLRPAQDCSLGYGKGLVLNEVEVLNELEFRERPLRRFSPDWMSGNSVFHTLNASERFWWFDGKSLPPRPHRAQGRKAGARIEPQRVSPVPA